MQHYRQKLYIESKSRININRKLPSFGPIVISEKYLIINEWEGHKDQISSLFLIPNPLGFVSGSLDKHVKVWSYLGEEWGDINIVAEVPVRNWNFPFNWWESREKDRTNVISLMKEFEPKIDPTSYKIVYAEEPQILSAIRNYKLPEILPKRCFMPTKKLDKHGRNKVKSSQDNVVNIEEEEAKIKKIRAKEEKPEPAFVQDLMAFVDMYKDSSKEKKKEILKGMNKLKECLREFFNNNR